MFLISASKLSSSSLSKHVTTPSFKYSVALLSKHNTTPYLCMSILNFFYYSCNLWSFTPSVYSTVPSILNFFMSPSLPPTAFLSYYSSRMGKKIKKGRNGLSNLTNRKLMENIIIREDKENQKARTPQSGHENLR